MLFEKKDKENISDSRKRILKDINDVQNNNVINNEYINPLASPSEGAPALNYGDVNTETTSPGEVKGLIKIKLLNLLKLLGYLITQMVVKMIILMDTM